MSYVYEKEMKSIDFQHNKMPCAYEMKNKKHRFSNITH